jgi:hypothetical protein
MIKIAEKICEAMDEDESENYEEYIADGRKPQDHVYYYVLQLHKELKYWKKMYRAGLRFLSMN